MDPTCLKQTGAAQVQREDPHQSEELHVQHIHRQLRELAEGVAHGAPQAGEDLHRQLREVPDSLKTTVTVLYGRYSDYRRYEGLPNGRYRYVTALPLQPL